MDYIYLYFLLCKWRLKQIVLEEKQDGISSDKLNG
jgi:hypothetical protein